MQHIKDSNKADIIFVCYYFPPHDNVGVRRVLFWANFFSDKGLDVLVVTTRKTDSNLMYQVLDKRIQVIEYSSFSEEIVQTKSSPTGQDLNESQESNRGFFFKILQSFKRKFVNKYIGQLFDLRVFPILLYVTRILFGFSKLNKFNLTNCTVISTAPPWPMHLLGIAISKIFSIPLLVDYRDPFSSNHMFSKNLVWLEKALDKKICSSANHVLTVSPSWVDYYKGFNERTVLIRNGYDESLVSKNSGNNLYHDGKLILNYFGSIEHSERVPELLFDYLEGSGDVLVNFYGSCSLIQDFLDNHPNLNDNIILHGNLSYSECIDMMSGNGINLISETFSAETLSHKGVIPTKVYEYIAAGSPILAIINDNLDMAEILRKSGLCIGVVSNIEELKKVLSFDYINSLNLNQDRDFITSLSRQHSSNYIFDLLNGSYDEKNI